ncbi:MAG: hypothetical protein NT156_09145 [Mycobacterium sp.]|nr:hypothetical protein [Mycobacterium sp.]
MLAAGATRAAVITGADATAGAGATIDASMPEPESPCGIGNESTLSTCGATSGTRPVLPVETVFDDTEDCALTPNVGVR